MKGQLLTIVKKLNGFFFTEASALSLHTSDLEASSFETVYVFVEKAVFWISALQMSGKNRDHFESPLSVRTNPVYKNSWESLPAKQAISAFN